MCLKGGLELGECLEGRAAGDDPTARFTTERRCDEPYRTERIEHFRGMANPTELRLAEIRQELNRNRRIGWNLHRPVTRAGIVTAVDPNGKSGFLPSQEFLTREQDFTQHSPHGENRENGKPRRPPDYGSRSSSKPPTVCLASTDIDHRGHESQACCHQASV